MIYFIVAYLAIGALYGLHSFCVAAKAMLRYHASTFNEFIWLLLSFAAFEGLLFPLFFGLQAFETLKEDIRFLRSGKD